MGKSNLVVPTFVEQRIFLIRGQKVMVDRDLAELFEVETKYLNRQVRRNRDRFPSEFMFKLNSKETNELVTNCHRFSSLKHSVVRPNVFTEHGIAMLSTVLKSQRAIRMSVLIIKAFVRLREMLSMHEELAKRLQELEARIHNHDETIRSIIEAIRGMLTPADGPRRRIGYRVDEPKPNYRAR